MGIGFIPRIDNEVLQSGHGRRKARMSQKTKTQYRYPYRPKPAVVGNHGQLSAHICTCLEGWCWEVREDGQTILHGTNSTMVDGMAAARYYFLEKLTPDERRSEKDCHDGNPEMWQEERPEDDYHLGKRSRRRAPEC